MNALGDLVARQRRSGEAASGLPSQRSGRRRNDDSALVAAGDNRTYDYRRFCTTAWKTGNFWRRRGVHEDATVAVADDPAPEAVFSFLGAALLGARTRFDPPRDSDARVVVAGPDEIGDYEVPPGGTRVAYGGQADDPAVAHFERDVWSENPAFPETPVDPGTAALVTEDDGFSHADLLTPARAVADDWGLEPGDAVAIRASLADPGTVVAGVLAPLLAGAAILLPDEGAVGDFAVVTGDETRETELDAPESQVLSASAIV